MLTMPLGLKFHRGCDRQLTVSIFSYSGRLSRSFFTVLSICPSIRPKSTCFITDKLLRFCLLNSYFNYPFLNFIFMLFHVKNNLQLLHHRLLSSFNNKLPAVSLAYTFTYLAQLDRSAFLALKKTSGLSSGCLTQIATFDIFFFIRICL